MTTSLETVPITIQHPIISRGTSLHIEQTTRDRPFQKVDLRSLLKLSSIEYKRMSSPYFQFLSISFSKPSIVLFTTRLETVRK